MESRKNTESGRKAAESWTGPRTLSPQHIIAFFGDTNYINHAQIRYVCEINHSPSGATRPRVSRFIVPIGHDLSNTCTLVQESFQHMYSLVVRSTFSLIRCTHTHIHLHTLTTLTHTGSDHLTLLTEHGDIYTLGCAEQGQLGRVPECFSSRGGRKEPLSFSDQTLSGSGSRKEQENPNSRTFSAVLTTPLRPHREGRCMYGD